MQCVQILPPLNANFRNYVMRFFEHKTKIITFASLIYT